MIKILLSGAFYCLMIAAASAQPPSIGGFNVYYGDLHNHSAVSDGTGTPAAAYNYARNIAHLDFFGLSDHSESITAAEWADIKNQADTYNRDSVFSSFYGFEWSSGNGYGHIGVFNTVDYCATNPPTNTFEGLVIWLASRPAAIAFFNHPGKEDYGNEFNHLTTTPSDQLVGMELWNQGQNFNVYYYNDGYYRSDNNKSYFDEANSRGWKAGACGDGDDHTATWGTAHPYRMAILSNYLTRGDLLAAMQARRFFSTLDKNLSLSFKINGMEMGSTLTGGNYTFQIQAADADGEIFNQVILYNKNHDTVNLWSLSTSTVNVSLNLNTIDGDYYYVKVKQADSDEAISSPIWISGSVSNKNPYCAVSVPANGANYTLPVNINLNASAIDIDGSISKVEFYEGTTKLGEDSISPYTLNWISTTPGIYKFSVKATDNLGAASTSSVITVNITPRLITVTADARTKTYGDPDPILTYRITSGSLTGTDTFSGALTRDAGENVGTYLIKQGTLTLNSNYFITFAGANLNITPRLITVTAGPKSKVYGNADPALTYQISSGSLAGSDTFSGALTRDAGENAGIYLIRRGTLAINSNYTLTFMGANFSIASRAITITALSKSKVYGNTDPLLTWQITSGTLAGTDIITGNLSRTPGENIGMYAINQGTLTPGSNYTVSFTGANLNISARLLSITANNKSKVYGDIDPVLTYQITSGTLAGTDVISGELTRAPGENAGTYPITTGTVTAGTNYLILFTGANLNITPKPVSVTAVAGSKVYGDGDLPLTYSITSGTLAGTDSFDGELTRGQGEDAGIYPILQGSLTAGNNYALSYSGADFVITARPITIAAEPGQKVIGEPDPQLIYHIISGNLAGQDTFSGSLTRTPGESAGTYPISIGSVSAGSNYTLLFESAAFTIFESFEVKVYPNPFSDQVTFELVLNNNAIISIDLFNITGIKVATVFSGNAEASTHHFDYQPQNLSKEILFYRLTIDGIIMATGKLIHK